MGCVCMFIAQPAIMICLCLPITLCNGSRKQIHCNPAIRYFNTEHETVSSMTKMPIRLIQAKQGCKGLAGEGTGVND